MIGFAGPHGVADAVLPLLTRDSCLCITCTCHARTEGRQQSQLLVHSAQLFCELSTGLRPIVSMGRPSTVRFGRRRVCGAAAGKRARAAPSVLSFRAVNQVLQNVLQVNL